MTKEEKSEFNMYVNQLIWVGRNWKEVGQSKEFYIKQLRDFIRKISKR